MIGGVGEIPLNRDGLKDSWYIQMELFYGNITAHTFAKPFTLKTDQYSLLWKPPLSQNSIRSNLLNIELYCSIDDLDNNVPYFTTLEKMLPEHIVFMSNSNGVASLFTNFTL